jgi:hypothetical protein
VKPAALALAAAGVIGLTLLASACGGSSGAKVAQVGTTTGAKGSASSSASGAGDAQAYSACMRSHGVPNFPDPGADGSIHLGAAIDQHSPTYQAASRGCRAGAPGGVLTEHAEAQLQRQILAFAACMRTHGVHAFPDPVLGHGHILFEPDPRQPIDAHAAAFTAAVAACRARCLRSTSRSSSAPWLSAAANDGSCSLVLRHRPTEPRAAADGGPSPRIVQDRRAGSAA